MYIICVDLPAARSPVFSHLSSSLQGLWTIRALRAEERLKKAFDAHQDLHSGAALLQTLHQMHCTMNRLGKVDFTYIECFSLVSEAWFLFLMTSRWFALRLDSICSIFITMATFGCILLRDGEEHLTTELHELKSVHNLSSASRNEWTFVL